MRLIALLTVVLLVALVFAVAYCIELRRRIKESDNPVLSLPRRERRAQARELLAREKRQYELLQQQQLHNIIYNRGEQK